MVSPKIIKILINEGWKGLILRYQDHREFRSSLATPDHRSLIEALQAELPGGWKSSKDPQENFLKLKLYSFLVQDHRLLVFPPFKKPTVSIIVSLCHPATLTFQCLESILAFTTVPYELILIHNNQNDEETAALLKRIENIKIIAPEEPQGFIESSNQGAGLASGDFIFFLGNDTAVTPHWASRLMEKMSEKPDCGAAGVKLIHPGGQLLEAGNLLWQDASYRAYGKGDNPFKPEYSYARPVDFCSSAGLLVRKKSFQALGGFDPQFSPAIYEDADLCLRITRQGSPVMYLPGVTVFHYGLPRFGSLTVEKTIRETNRLKFMKKWDRLLAGKYQASDVQVPTARDLRPGPSILFIEDRIPAPPQGAGFPRSFQIIRFLSELGYRVTVLPTINRTPWQPFTRELEDLGVETLYGNFSIQKLLETRKNGFELVWISRHHNLAKYFGLVKDLFPEAALVFDSEALFSLRELEKIKLTATRHRQVREIQFQEKLREEFRRMKQADLVVTVSEREKGLMGAAGVKNIQVWSHAVPRQTPSAPFADRKDLLFVGGFTARESPNTAAVLYFLEKVFPALEKRLGCRLLIVGSTPPDLIRDRASETVVVTGYQKNLEHFYHQCRLFVVPHQYAGGIPLKLLEAMGQGIPAVVSPVVAEQLGFKEEKEVLIAAAPDDFIQKISTAYTDETLWGDLQKNAWAYIERNCEPASLKTKLRELIEMARNVKAGN
jgi:GT2 family glycosyltransferase/glycosyltransferase involved in cell wall biosynthesis